LLKDELMQQFHYKALPIDVHFGVGKSNEAKDVLLQHGYQKVLVITTPGQEEAGRQTLILTTSPKRNEINS
jgi:maleylacetate reductase